MPLTTIVGSSGSGKTTFLEHVHKTNQCCYLRQYHALRPFLAVNNIPDFNPSHLPYWSLYTQNKDDNGNKNKAFNPAIKVGGSVGADVIPGLSGGQRKMLMFELVKQRSKNSTDLLILFDEPFAGVTDDFVPFIVSNLKEMRAQHNVLLVTNDHIEAMTQMSDSIITVSVTDRSNVMVDNDKFDREIALRAVAVGKNYTGSLSKGTLSFFLRSELFTNPQVPGLVIFTSVTLGLFVMAFYNSQSGSEALIVTASQMIQYFSVNPYMLSLPDWRDSVLMEADALLHSSLRMYKFLKACLALACFLFVSGCTFGIIQVCTTGLSGANVWAFLLMDVFSVSVIPFVCFGLYTNTDINGLQIMAIVPFLTMMLFSTAFSPSSGVEGVKALRYLYVRFYFWCSLPSMHATMDGCPSDASSLGIAVAVGCITPFLFALVGVFKMLPLPTFKAARAKQLSNEALFADLQAKLYKNHGGAAYVKRQNDVFHV